MKLNIFDICGTERVLSIVSKEYKKANAAVFVFSVDDETSLKAIEYRVKYLDTERDNPKIVKILVANMRDLK